MLEASGHLKAGKLRALAVTGDKRVSALPDVPTLSESVLPGFNAISWLGLLAPAGTRPEVVEKIAADARAVPADEAIKARFAALGGVSRGTSPKEFAKLIADDKARCAQIIRNRKITLESTRRAGRQEHDGLCLATEVSKLAPADFLLSGVTDLSLISVFRQPGSMVAAHVNATGLIFKRCALRAITVSSVAICLAWACSAHARCSASPARNALSASSAITAAR